MNTIQNAISELKKGKMIILVDDEHRENEGDLVIAAETITPEKMNFIIRHTSGIVCLSLTEEKIKALNLPAMVNPSDNTSRFGTGFTVSIEAKTGVTTGVSAADRVRTIQVAIAKDAKPDDLARPGHVFPLCAKAGGVLVREGHTEGSVDLVQLAGFSPAAVICEIMNSDGSMARRPELELFAKQHDLLIVSIQELKAHRMNHEVLVEEISAATLPIEGLGDFTIRVFRDTVKKEECVVLQRGEIEQNQPTTVRIHSQCLTGDLFSSQRCDCGSQLQASLKILAEKQGLLIYLEQEGRGIGIANKIKAYALQEQGMDTVEANGHLGFPDDLREYGMAIQILRYLKVKAVNLLTNNPRKINALIAGNFDVTRLSLITHASEHNRHYLMTKKSKLGHLMGEL